jgi:hypothetical protein
MSIDARRGRAIDGIAGRGFLDTIEMDGALIAAKFSNWDAAG